MTTKLEAIKELMDANPQVEQLSGPVAARSLRALRVVHNEMLANPTKYEGLEAFTIWLGRHVEALSKKVHDFEKQLAQDLRDDSDRLNRMSAEWSVVDGDGLDL